MRAILYARVSTPGQEDGYSIEQQFGALNMYCQEHGIEVVAEVFDVESGASLERPGIGEMLDLIKEHSVNPIDMVLAQDRDRIGRGTSAAVLKHEFKKRECGLVALNDPDEDDYMGQFVAQVMDAVSQLERAMTTVRTMRGRRKRVEKGDVSGSCPPPFGYAYTEDRRSLVVTPSDMDTVRRIFELVAAGSSINSICTTFDAEGVPTVGNYRKKGEQWYPSTIQRIVFNDAYKGTWVWGGRRTKLTPDGKHKRSVEAGKNPITLTIPQVIPTELIDRARKRINDNYKPRPTSDRYFELARLLHCGECGTRMTHYKSGKYSYYVCQYRRHKKRLPRDHESMPGQVCEGPSIAADKLEEAVKNHADTMVRDPRRLQEHFDTAIEAVAAEDPKHWHKLLQDYSRKRTQLEDMYLEGRLTATRYDERLAELDELESVARTKLTEAQNSESRIEELNRDRATLSKLGTTSGIMDLTPEARRRVYEALRLRMSLSSDGVILYNAVWDNDVSKELGITNQDFSPNFQLSGRWRGSGERWPPSPLPKSSQTRFLNDQAQP